MRILYAIQELRGGGAERIFETLARAAREAGHAVAVASAADEPEAESGLRNYRLPLVERRPWQLTSAARALRRAIRTERSDLVHAHNPGMAGAASLATMRGRRVPGLVSVHGVPEDDYGRAATVLRLGGLPVVACGPGVAAALEEHRVRVRATIVNGVPPPSAPADKVQVLSALGLPPNRPLVLSVGRLVEQKNHALLIRALAEVPEAVAIIVGEGPLRAELEAEVAAVGIEDRLALAGERPDARDLIAAADVVALPSRWEGLPLVALEALAAGTPLVATRVRGVRELVDANSALLVPPGDTTALAEGLRRVLADGQLRQRLGRAGRQLAHRHSEQAMAEAYLRLYERLVER